MTKAKTLALLEDIKEVDQDFEWYPTTDEIINTICDDLKGHEGHFRHSTLLDIGAGDGRVLEKMKEQCEAFSSLYAIEKSEPLISAMHKDIVIVGTEFSEQQLIDKEVDVIFCNPPYSQFAYWMEKIIKESYCEIIYFVVPERWENNKNIKDIIEKRNAKFGVIGSHDFHNADRKARAKVSIVKVVLRHSPYSKKHDPFDLFFEEEFENLQKRETLTDDEKMSSKTISNQLVKGENLIKSLADLYMNDMQTLHNNFNAIKELDYEIFKSLNININTVKDALKEKINGCKNLYWTELFDRLDKITDRLCSKQRDKLLSKIRQHNTLDFTVSNALAVVIWVIKNANDYYDEQLTDVYRDLLAPENVNNYKSNQVLTGEKDYMYSRWDYRNNAKDVYLKTDYRIVYDAGTTFGEWEYQHRNGLKDRALFIILDIFTVAKNLGFDIIDDPRTCEKWAPGEIRTFAMRHEGQVVEFASIRAYKNGNLHFKLNQAFLKKWNVEAGRLLGWLKDAEYAKKELDDAEVEKYWNQNYKVKNTKLLV